MVTVTEAPLDRVPILEDVSGDYYLHVYYNNRNQFEIAITQKSTGQTKTDSFTATHEPVWGPDIQDMEDILARAETLCEEFESVI